MSIVRQDDDDNKYVKIETEKELEDYANDNRKIYIKERPFSRPQEKIKEYDIVEFTTDPLPALFTKDSNDNTRIFSMGIFDLHFKDSSVFYKLSNLKGGRFRSHRRRKNTKRRKNNRKKTRRRRRN